VLAAAVSILLAPVRSTAAGVSDPPVSASFSTLVPQDAEAARKDLIAAFGGILEPAPTFTVELEPNVEEYARSLVDSGMHLDEAALVEQAAYWGQGLAGVDPTMLRLLSDSALPALLCHIHALEVLGQLRPLTPDENASLLDDYELLWTVAGLYPTPDDVAGITAALGEQTMWEAGAWATRYAAWEPVIWEALRYRLVHALKQPAEDEEERERIAGRAAGSARILWRRAQDEPAARLYLAATRYAVALEPSPDSVANLYWVAVYLGGPVAVPASGEVAVEVAAADGFTHMRQAAVDWQALQTLESDDTFEGRMRSAELLVDLGRTQEARARFGAALQLVPGDGLALARLAITYVEPAPRLAHAVISRSDPAAPGLGDEYWSARFPIEWNHFMLLTAPVLSGAATSPHARQLCDQQLETIARLVARAGDAAPKSRAYSTVLAGAFQQLWLGGMDIDDVDLTASVPLLEEVNREQADADLYRLLLFAAAFGPEGETRRVYTEPLPAEFDDETRCGLHARRASLLVRLVDDQTGEGSDGLAREIDAMAASCGETPLVSRLRGDLAVSRSIVGRDVQTALAAVPAYEACVEHGDPPLAATCLSNLYVLHDALDQPEQAEAALGRYALLSGGDEIHLFHSVSAEDPASMPHPTQWLKAVTSCGLMADESLRLHICAGDLAHRQGDVEEAEALWTEACRLLGDDCAADPHSCLPNWIAGVGTMSMYFTGRVDTPVSVELEVQTRLLGTCNEAFVEWLEQTGCRDAEEPR